jgi:hypothetical protein
MVGLGLDTVVLRFIRVGGNWLYWDPTKQAYVKISAGQGNLVTRLLAGKEKAPVVRRTRKPKQASLPLEA